MLLLKNATKNQMISSTQKIVKLILGLVLLSIVNHSCVDEYWPDIDSYDKLIVIDGMITNQPGPFQVQSAGLNKHLIQALR